METLFTKIYNKSNVREEWKQSITISMFKKKQKKRILAEVILQTGINEKQQGFWENRSTTDAILIFRQIAETSIEYNKPAFVCFIDLTKAFDRVRLSDVLKLLKDRNLNPKTIKIIKKMNIGNSTFIKANNKLSKKIPVLTGNGTVLVQYYLLS